MFILDYTYIQAKGGRGWGDPQEKLNYVKWGSNLRLKPHILKISTDCNLIHSIFLTKNIHIVYVNFTRYHLLTLPPAAVSRAIANLRSLT